MRKPVGTRYGSGAKMNNEELNERKDKKRNGEKFGSART